MKPQPLWSAKLIHNSRVESTDKRYGTQYDDLFPDIIPDDKSFPTLDSIEDEERNRLMNLVVTAYLEAWDSEDEIPNLDDIESEVIGHYELDILEMLEADYEDDEQFHVDDEYRCEAEEMYLESFWGYQSSLISSAIIEALDYMRLTYIADDAEKVGSEYISYNSFVNPAQNILFKFLFSRHV